MVSLGDGVTNIFPALPVLINLAVIQSNLRQRSVDHVRVLVKPHLAPLSHGEVSPFHAFPIRISGDPAPVGLDLMERSEFHVDVESGFLLRRFPRRAEDGEPAGDALPRGDLVYGDLRGADDLRAEDVVVLDLELEVGERVRNGDVEVLVPERILRVLQDARAGESRLRDDDGYVGIAGDDLAVSADVSVAAAAVVSASGIFVVWWWFGA